jgi:hypothetical protein
MATKGKAKGSKNTKQAEVPTNGEVQVKNAKSMAYSLANALRGIEWGTDMGRAQTLNAISDAESLTGMLKMALHTFPPTPLWAAAHKVSECRDNLGVCGSGVVAYDAKTYEGAQFYADLKDVPAGLATLDVKGSYGKAEREREDKHPGPYRLWLISMELQREADKARRAVA